MFRPGNQPSCIACRVRENAPVMIDWLAMTVAQVASTTSGITAQAGASLKNGIALEAGVLQQQRGLAGVAQQQGRQHDGVPGRPDRVAAEMPHVGIQRLTAGDRQEHAAEDDETVPAMRDDEPDRVQRVDRQDHLRPPHDAGQAEHRDDHEPQQHDRAEHPADAGGALHLRAEQTEQHHQRRGHHVGLEHVGGDVDALQRAEHRDRRRDDPVAVDQRRAEQAGDDQGPTRVPACRCPILAGHQRHQGQDAALAMVVRAHHEDAVLDRDGDDQRPDDQREQPERVLRGRDGRRRCRRWPGRCRAGWCRGRHRRCPAPPAPPRRWWAGRRARFPAVAPLCRGCTHCPSPFGSQAGDRGVMSVRGAHRRRVRSGAWTAIPYGAGLEQADCRVTTLLAMTGGVAPDAPLIVMADLFQPLPRWMRRTSV